MKVLMENSSGFDLTKTVVDNKRKTVIITSAMILVIAAGVGFWYWSRSKQTLPSPEAPTLGSEIFEKTQNPVQGRVPNANPFKNQKNPLDTIYKNPFE